MKNKNSGIFMNSSSVLNNFSGIDYPFKHWSKLWMLTGVDKNIYLYLLSILQF